MIPKNRNRRILLVSAFAIMFATGTFLLLSVLNKNTQFFYDPSEILVENFAPKSTDIRVGGLVLYGTVEKTGDLTTRFRLADFSEREDYEPSLNDSIIVSYTGILPDLFREGQGIVVTGALIGRDDLIAREVLAKHDENYQPKKYDDK